MYAQKHYSPVMLCSYSLESNSTSFFHTCIAASRTAHAHNIPPAIVPLFLAFCCTVLVRLVEMEMARVT